MGNYIKVKREALWTTFSIAKSKQSGKSSSVFIYIPLTHTLGIKVVTKHVFDDLALTQMSLSKDFADKEDFLGLYNE